MKDILIKNRHRIVLTVFIVIHSLACLFTTYFGDDYYYAAFLKNGTNYMISENVYHYMNTNGRALVHLIDELLLGYSFYLWQIAAIAVMTALVVVLAKLAAQTWREKSDNDTYKNAIIAVCAIFSLTEIAILRQSVYWATGSLNYLFPATLTLWYIYLLRRAVSREAKIYPLALLALIAGATSEQASAAVLLAVLWLMVYSFIQKKSNILLPLLVNLAAATGGFLTLVLAPGSSARTVFYPEFYELPFFERIIKNIPTLGAIVLGPNGLCALIAALLIITAYRSYKKVRWLTVISALATVGYLYAVTINPEFLRAYWFMIILIIPLAVVMIKTAFDFFEHDEADNLYFVWCAVAMQCAMLISPEFGSRTLTISLLLLIVPIARAIIEINSSLMYGLLSASALVIVIGDFSPILIALLFIAVAVWLALSRWGKLPIFPTLAVCIALANFAAVPIGYYENLDAHRKNYKQVTSYDPSLGEPLYLYYLPNDVYKYTMPYDNLYHEHVYLMLHGLSPDTEIVYVMWDK